MKKYALVTALLFFWRMTAVAGVKLSVSVHGYAVLIIKASKIVIPENELTIHVFDNILRSSPLNRDESFQITAKRKNGNFYFRVPIGGPFDYFSLTTPGASDLLSSPDYSVLLSFPTYYVLEPGDEISIEIKPDSTAERVNKYTYTFRGTGSAKFSCMREMEESAYFHKGIEVSGVFITGDNRYESNNFVDVQIRCRLEVLQQYQSQITPSLYSLLEFDAKVSGLERKYITFWQRWIRAKNEPKRRDSLRALYQQYFAEEISAPAFLQLNAPGYFTYILEKSWCDNLLHGVTGDAISLVYQMLKEKFSGEVRQKAITAFFLKNPHFVAESDSLVRDAQRQTVLEPYRSVMADLSRGTKGSVAFNFSLPDMHGHFRQLSDFAGKVVLIDFWFTGCGACSDFFIKHLSSVEEKFGGDTSVVFISINVDTKRNQWLSSIASGKYTSAHAINLYTNGEGIEHPLIKYYQFPGFPQQLLIGPDGKISAGNLRSRTELEAAILKSKSNENTKR